MEKFKKIKIGELEYLTIPSFIKDGKVAFAFSTRKGGVSKGEFGTMNMGHNRGDKIENVRKNYDILCGAIGVDAKNTVFSAQVHNDVIHVARGADCGKGLYLERELMDADGLITNEAGVALVTFYADCVPLFFYDPKKCVIASIHSGWKGTVKKIGKKAIEKMVSDYDCNPADILGAIGPCIKSCHFECDIDCAQQFMLAFPTIKEEIIEKGENGKFYIDLIKANLSLFTQCGLKEENITVADECTYCDEEMYFSHRRMGDKRGSLCCIMQIL